MTQTSTPARARRLILTVGLTLALPITVLQGCTQMPTEKQGVVDMHPQISFKADTPRHGARIVLDGLDMGTLGTYLDGAAALRIVPGTHQLQVIQGAQVLLDERFYAGEGVQRTFVVR